MNYGYMLKKYMSLTGPPNCRDIVKVGPYPPGLDLVTK